MNLLKLSRPIILCALALAMALSNTLVQAAEDHHAEPAAAHRAADSDKPRFKPERMWLPSSAQHLRPYLLLAAEQALKDEECAEILYARLNEYRTVYEEPTFSVLCRKDYKTTFNRVYQVSELDQYYDAKVADSQAIAESATGLSSDIESLRQSLLIPSDAIISNSLPAAVAESKPEPRQPGETRARREENPDDLSLDLDMNF
jgi:hypothetical protein